MLRTCLPDAQSAAGVLQRCSLMAKECEALKEVLQQVSGAEVSVNTFRSCSGTARPGLRQVCG